MYVQSNFVIVGQKTFFYALFAVSNKILLSFCVIAAAVFLSIIILAILTIKKDLKISSALYQQLYTSPLIQAIFLTLLIGLVLMAKSEIKNKSTSYKRSHTKQGLEI